MRALSNDSKFYTVFCSLWFNLRCTAFSCQFNPTRGKRIGNLFNMNSGVKTTKQYVKLTYGYVKNLTWKLLHRSILIKTQNVFCIRVFTGDVLHQTPRICTLLPHCGSPLNAGLITENYIHRARGNLEMIFVGIGASSLACVAWFAFLSRELLREFFAPEIFRHLAMWNLVVVARRGGNVVIVMPTLKSQSQVIACD